MKRTSITLATLSGLLLTGAAFAQDASVHTASPDDAAALGDREVRIDGPEGAVVGSYRASGKDAAPLVVIIAGSGPTDRDGNNPLGVMANSYKLLAEGLAAKGIDTIRYDKRGMAASASALTNPNAVTIADYATDALAFAEQGIAASGLSCAWLLGHSEGGLIALAAPNTPNICGLILVATPGRPVGDVLRDQLKANPANALLLDQALAAITSLEAGEAVDDSTLHPALLPLFNKNVQPFVIDLMSYNPQQIMAQVDKPVLLLFGDKDIQTADSEGALLKAANDSAALVVLPDVNHVLKTVTGDDVASNFAAYQNPDLPLADGVVDTVADFILKQP